MTILCNFILVWYYLYILILIFVIYLLYRLAIFIHSLDENCYCPVGDIDNVIHTFWIKLDTLKIRLKINSFFQFVDRF